MTSEALTLFDLDEFPGGTARDRRPSRRRTGAGRRTAGATDRRPTVQARDTARPATSPTSEPLPPTLDVVSAGALLGVGRTIAYRLVREGAWPTHVVRVGRKVVIPTVPLLEFLGISAVATHAGISVPTNALPELAVTPDPEAGWTQTERPR